MRSGGAITRRAFGILAAAAPLALAYARNARAQKLPDCFREGQYGGFTIIATRYDDGLGYSAYLPQTRVRSGNALGHVDVVAVSVHGDIVYGTAPGEPLSITFETNESSEPIFGSGETGFYEIYAGGQRIFAQTLRRDDFAPTLANSAAAVRRMLASDSTVRLTLGATSRDWAVSAANLAGALQAAKTLSVQVEQDYARKVCAPVVPCLLTTVACREIGLADDCFELRTVRRLRDSWLVNQPFGPAALAWYRENSRMILAAIPISDVARVLTRFYAMRLVPAVVVERLGLHKLAFAWLKRGVEKLHARYISQTA